MSELLSTFNEERVKYYSMSLLFKACSSVIPSAGVCPLGGIRVCSAVREHCHGAVQSFDYHLRQPS